MSEEDSPGWPYWMDEWVLPYVKESTLWPVLFAIAGHFVVVYAMILLSVYRDGLQGHWGWLLFSMATSFAPATWELRLFKRPGGVFVVVFLTWAAAVAVAWIGERTGFI